MSWSFPTRLLQSCLLVFNLWLQCSECTLLPQYWTMGDPVSINLRKQAFPGANAIINFVWKYTCQFGTVSLRYQPPFPIALHENFTTAYSIPFEFGTSTSGHACMLTFSGVYNQRKMSIVWAEDDTGTHRQVALLATVHAFRTDSYRSQIIEISRGPKQLVSTATAIADTRNIHQSAIQTRWDNPKNWVSQAIYIDSITKQWKVYGAQSNINISSTTKTYERRVMIHGTWNWTDFHRPMGGLYHMIGLKQQNSNVMNYYDILGLKPIGENAVVGTMFGWKHPSSIPQWNLTWMSLNGGGVFGEWRTYVIDESKSKAYVLGCSPHYGPGTRYTWAWQTLNSKVSNVLNMSGPATQGGGALPPGNYSTYLLYTSTGTSMVNANNEVDLTQVAYTRTYPNLVVTKMVRPAIILNDGIQENMIPLRVNGNATHVNISVETVFRQLKFVWQSTDGVATIGQVMVKQFTPNEKTYVQFPVPEIYAPRGSTASVMLFAYLEGCPAPIGSSVATQNIFDRRQVVIILDSTPVPRDYTFGDPINVTYNQAIFPGYENITEFRLKFDSDGAYYSDNCATFERPYKLISPLKISGNGFYMLNFSFGNINGGSRCVLEFGLNASTKLGGNQRLIQVDGIADGNVSSRTPLAVLNVLDPFRADTFGSQVITIGNVEATANTTATATGYSSTLNLAAKVTNFSDPKMWVSQGIYFTTDMKWKVYARQNISSVTVSSIDIGTGVRLLKYTLEGSWNPVDFKKPMGKLYHMIGLMTPSMVNEVNSKSEKMNGKMMNYFDVYSLNDMYQSVVVNSSFGLTLSSWDIPQFGLMKLSLNGGGVPKYWWPYLVDAKTQNAFALGCKPMIGDSQPKYFDWRTLNLTVTNIFDPTHRSVPGGRALPEGSYSVYMMYSSSRAIVKRGDLTKIAYRRVKGPSSLSSQFIVGPHSKNTSMTPIAFNENGNKKEFGVELSAGNVTVLFYTVYEQVMFEWQCVGCSGAKNGSVVGKVWNKTFTPGVAANVSFGLPKEVDLKNATGKLEKVLMKLVGFVYECDGVTKMSVGFIKLNVTIVASKGKGVNGKINGSGVAVILGVCAFVLAVAIVSWFLCLRKGVDSSGYIELDPQRSS